MAKLTRRSLIKQTSIGVAGAATISVLAAAPHLAGAAPAHQGAMEQSAPAPSGSLVVHVRNFSTGEIGVMYGEKEVVLRDPALVTRLLQAAG
jgi:hypothetical protein